MAENVADKFLRNFFKIVVAVLIVTAFIYILLPFLIPVTLGGIWALAMNPLVAYFTNKGYRRNLTLMALTSSLFVIGVAPITIVFIRGVKAINIFLSEQSLILIKQNIEKRIYVILDHFSNVNDIDPYEIREKFDGLMTSLGSYILKFFSKLMAHIPDVILLGFISVLSFYFFLLSEDSIRKFFDKYFCFSKINGDRFIDILKSTCREIFFSNVVTAIIQASIVTAGAFFADIGDPFTIFICTFFFSFMPFIGAGPFAFFIALFAFLEQKTGAGITMMVVAIISGVSDNFIRPYLTNLGTVKVHSFITFLAIIGGVLVMGLPGLFLGPLLALLTFGALPIILDDYFPERNHEYEVEHKN